MSFQFDDGIRIALAAATQQQASMLWVAVKNLEGAPPWRLAVNTCLKRRNLDAACALAHFKDPAFDSPEHQGERLAHYFPHRITGLVNHDEEGEAQAIDRLMDSGLVGLNAWHNHEGEVYSPLAWLLAHDYDQAASAYLARGEIADTDLGNSLYFLLRPEPILGTNDLSFLEFSQSHRHWIRRVLDQMGDNPGLEQRTRNRAMERAQRFGSQHLDLARRLLRQEMETWTQGGTRCPMILWLECQGDASFALETAKGKAMDEAAMARIIQLLCLPSVFDEDSAMPRLAQMLEDGHICLHASLGRKAMIPCAHLLLRAGMVLEMAPASIRRSWQQLERVLEACGEKGLAISPWLDSLCQIHLDAAGQATADVRQNPVLLAEVLKRAIAKAEDTSLDCLTAQVPAKPGRGARL